MDELTQSYDHLKLAAGHAAGGAAEMVTPSYDRARDVAMRGWGTTRQALNPLYEQFRDGAESARKGARKGYVVEVTASKKRNRWPMLAGLLAAGTAVGAAGAIMARRRRNMSEWDEYEPLGGIDTGYGVAEPKASAGNKLSQGAASVASSVSSGASKVADSLHGRSSRTGDTMGDMAKGLGHKADSTAEAMTDQPRPNSRP